MASNSSESRTWPTSNALTSRCAPASLVVIVRTKSPDSTVQPAVSTRSLSADTRTDNLEAIEISYCPPGPTVAVADDGAGHFVSVGTRFNLLSHPASAPHRRRPRHGCGGLAASRCWATDPLRNQHPGHCGRYRRPRAFRESPIFRASFALRTGKHQNVRRFCGNDRKRPRSPNSHSPRLYVVLRQCRETRHSDYVRPTTHSGDATVRHRQRWRNTGHRCGQRALTGAGKCERLPGKVRRRFHSVFSIRPPQQFSNQHAVAKNESPLFLGSTTLQVIRGTGQRPSSPLRARLRTIRPGLKREVANVQPF